MERLHRVKMPLDEVEELVPPVTKPPSDRRLRAIVICAHLRPGRARLRSRHFLQPLTGVHIGSLIDPQRFDVKLHHEDWHGPFDPTRAAGYDLIFLSGLQADFDRMRQLSYFFRCAGAVVVAGGSIPTQFPEFAAQFFDVVCAGGVDSVRQVVADYLAGRLARIYNSPITRIDDYELDYSLLARNGIGVPVHLVESSRGCSFRCSFCVIPAEAGGHTTYRLETVRRTIDNAIATSPRFSIRRLLPMVFLLDNNFSDDRDHMLAVADMMRTHPIVRGWGALVTQNVLRDRALIARLAASKCRGLFVGLESLDHVFLQRFRKKQNLGRDNVVDLIAATEAQGVMVGYGYLFDPRFQTVEQMTAQLKIIAATDALSMPVFLSLVSPLIGTEAFWADLTGGRLASNLRLRDLDGETIAYSKLADTQTRLSAFVRQMFQAPEKIVGRGKLVRKVIRRVLRSNSLNPVDWYIRAACSLHFFSYPSRRRTYLAGEGVLDPQYDEHPPDLSERDHARYFEPITVTNAVGEPAKWLIGKSDLF
jgi:hypothetical protein